MDAFVGTISGVVVGGTATYLTQRAADVRRERREAIDGVAQLFDRARNAFATFEASRRGVHVRLGEAIFPDLSESERRREAMSLEREGMERRQMALWEMRESLAALPSASDFRRFWDKDHEPSEVEIEEAMDLIAERRRHLYHQPERPWAYIIGRFIPRRRVR